MEVNGQLEPTHKTYVPYSQIISNNNTTQIKKKARKTLIDEGKGAQARLNDGQWEQAGIKDEQVDNLAVSLKYC